MHKCCVCASPGCICSLENAVPPVASGEGVEQGGGGSLINPMLWPIHKSYVGVVGRGELPVKIHAHFADVPKSRLVDPLSALCTRCFRIIYNVLQLEKQMLRMKAKISVKAGTPKEIRESTEMYVETANSREKSNAVQLEGSLSRQRKQRRRIKPEAQKLQERSTDEIINSGTRTRRKAAFAGLSKEIIEAELADEDSFELPNLDGVCVSPTEGIVIDEPSKELIKRPRQSRNSIITGRNQESIAINKTFLISNTGVKHTATTKKKKPSSNKKALIINLRRDEDDLHEANATALKRNVLIPAKERFFNCPKCCYYFRRNEFDAFQNHIHTECMITKRFACQICGHIYTSKNVLNCHIEYAHEKPRRMSKTIQVKPRKEYVSELTKIYESLHDKVDEISNQSPTSSKPKPNAAYEFKTLLDEINRELEEDNWPPDRHSAELHGKSTGSWKCWICFYESSKKSFWLTHVTRIHRDAQGKAFTCEHCRFPFVQKHHLREHYHEVHPEKNGFKCDDCDRKFLNKNSSHECSKIVCDICGECFDSRGARRKHLMTHSEYRPHACGVCSKTFQKREYLSIHMRTHDDLRPYQCDFCSKRFRTKSHNNNHLRIHTGEKPYICDSCGEAFISPQSLHNHMQSHSKSRKFTCNICDKTFRNAYDVKRHFVTHTGEKPFQCKVCKKAFNRRGNCLAHERTHELRGFKPVTYSCPNCDDIFDQQTDLEKHIKLSHGQSEATTEIEPIPEICLNMAMNDEATVESIKTKKAEAEEAIVDQPKTQTTPVYLSLVTNTV